jgi:hypothetical protein
MYKEEEGEWPEKCTHARNKESKRGWAKPSSWVGQQGSSATSCLLFILLVALFCFVLFVVFDF